MQTRSYIVIALILVVLASAGAVFVSQGPNDRAPAHGDFAHRFQPVPAAEPVRLSRLDQERQRQAGIGSVKHLQPVAIARER